jgi:hypothetical protein
MVPTHCNNTFVVQKMDSGEIVLCSEYLQVKSSGAKPDVRGENEPSLRLWDGPSRDRH